MSNYRIFIKDNYLQVVDIVTNELFQAPAAKVSVTRKKADSTEFFFEGIVLPLPAQVAGIEFEDTFDEAGDTYADLDTLANFYTANTGKSNAGAAAGDLDSTPTSGSTNGVESGGVFSALADKYGLDNPDGYQTASDVASALSTAAVGILNDRGNHDASGNVFPSIGGSGTSGAVKKGNLWTVSVAGTLGGVAVTIGDVVRALVDAPGQTAGNWVVTENNIGYVAENASNKSTSITADQGSNTKYASVKAIFDWANSVFTTTSAVASQVTTAISGLMVKSANGSDIANIATFRANLGVDKITSNGNSNYTILPTDKAVVTSATLTSSRTWTLPLANAVNAGYEIIVADLFGGVTLINSLVIARAGSDTINGATSVTIGAANGMRRLISDGVSKWTFDGGVMRISDFIKQPGAFSGTFALDALGGNFYNDLTQSGALPLAVGGSAIVGGSDCVKITANGSAITVPGAWINVGGDAISTTNGAINRIIVTKTVSEIWFTVKVN